MSRCWVSNYHCKVMSLNLKIMILTSLLMSDAFWQAFLLICVYLLLEPLIVNPLTKDSLNFHFSLL